MRCTESQLVDISLSPIGDWHPIWHLDG